MFGTGPREENVSKISTGTQIYQRKWGRDDEWRIPLTDINKIECMRMILEWKIVNIDWD